jgi:hypothetical protein
VTGRDGTQSSLLICVYSMFVCYFLLVDIFVISMSWIALNYGKSYSCISSLFSRHSGRLGRNY